MTVAEAARMLGLTPRAVAKRLEAGHMRGTKVNPRLWLISRAEVNRALAAGRMKPGPKPKGKRKGGRPRKQRDTA
jgi:excisionase family DNA binding protein